MIYLNINQSFKCVFASICFKVQTTHRQQLAFGEQRGPIVSQTNMGTLSTFHLPSWSNLVPLALSYHFLPISNRNFLWQRPFHSIQLFRFIWKLSHVYAPLIRHHLKFPTKIPKVSKLYTWEGFWGRVLCIALERCQGERTSPYIFAW